MEDLVFDTDEFFLFSRELEKHHAIFDKLWNLGKPAFSNKIETAAVSFDKVGECIDFIINPKFWKTLSFEQKQFVISHECLHVILYHGFRINNLPKEQYTVANLALDIIVNHLLITKFGFSRKVADPDNKLCWVDTVFKKNPPQSGRFYEFYFNLLMKELEKQQAQGQGQGGKTGKSGDGKSQPGDPSGNGGDPGDGSNINPDAKPLDDHSGLDSFNDKEFDEKLKETLSKEDVESLKDMIQGQTEDIKKQMQAEAGIDAGNTWVIANVGKVKPKKKWETIIKKWSSKYMKDNDVEQWAHMSRRLIFLPQDFMIPSDRDQEHFEKDRIQVWFFQDTSGSCSGFVDRFFTAAKSLPVEKFDVKMHCFDTRVFETTLESGKLYGFGGTSFDCIEKYIQAYMKKHNVKYPKAVFVITDGDGDTVKPQDPKVWHWFLQGSTRRYIPDQSKIYLLKDFE